MSWIYQAAFKLFKGRDEEDKTLWRKCKDFYAFSLGSLPFQEIRKDMNEVFGKSTSSYQIAEKWSTHFKLEEKILWACTSRQTF